MKKLQGDCVFWLVLLTGAAQLLLVCGEGSPDNTIRCPSDSVMAPINGMVSYSSPVENGSYVFGTVATFSCSPGFGLDGTSTRTCETEQGTFSGTTPSCIAIICSALPGIVNGMIIYFGNTTEPYDYRTTVRYQCHKGYAVKRGDSERTCTNTDDGRSSEGQWSGTAAVCSALCDDITLTNGWVTYDPTASSRLEGTTATHNCNSSYVLSGERERICQSDRTWSGEIVTCNATICPPLADSPYGSLFYSPNKSPYLYGTQATYTITCPPGQNRSRGNDVRICVGDGRSTVGAWTGTAPICAATIDIDECSGTAHGCDHICTNTPESYTCDCNSGYRLAADGRGCDDIDECTTVPNNNCDQVCTNTEGSFTCGCDAGYALDSDRTSCSAITCSAVPSIENGMVVYSSDTTSPYDYGTTATCECNPGYELTSGNKKRVCTKSGMNSEGIWNGTMPTCSVIAVSCGSPPPVMNASPGTPTPGTTYQGTVIYTCDIGYEVSTGITTATATCMADRTWGPLLTCQLVDCGSPPPGINASPGTPPSTTYRGTVTYTCNSGYEVSNRVTTATATCMANGIWEPLSTCTIVGCGDPPTSPNGSPGTPTSTTFGGTVSYTCNNRYYMSGSATVTCEASGNWSTRPTCSAICNDLQIENGDINYYPDTTPRTKETIALYSCVSGNKLSGVSIRSCVDGRNGMGGVWTGSMPSCIAICNSLILAHGVISYSSSTTPRLEGTVAIHSCDEGYGLSHNGRIRTCQPDRTWSGEDITCQRKHWVSGAPLSLMLRMGPSILVVLLHHMTMKQQLHINATMDMY
ncbi:sushi, von Willebrand factor type A, EGF and pentraxin domain-containing protein 1-like [Halichondria panicea]|uniref:sushi, von Willebrand factor type A, EGF and pentraxin domain-containing protein 1-like n=1 Tax=Halichondria panicea TaxID=6063 RepID=UPI00312B53F4